ARPCWLVAWAGSDFANGETSDVVDAAMAPGGVEAGDGGAGAAEALRTRSGRDEARPPGTVSVGDGAEVADSTRYDVEEASARRSGSTTAGAIEASPPGAASGADSTGSSIWTDSIDARTPWPASPSIGSTEPAFIAARRPWASASAAVSAATASLAARRRRRASLRGGGAEAGGAGSGAAEPGA